MDFIKTLNIGITTMSSIYTLSPGGRSVTPGRHGQQAWRLSPSITGSSVSTGPKRR